MRFSVTIPNNDGVYADVNRGVGVGIGVGLNRSLPVAFNDERQ